MFVHLFNLLSEEFPPSWSACRGLTAIFLDAFVSLVTWLSITTWGAIILDRHATHKIIRGCKKQKGNAEELDRESKNRHVEQTKVDLFTTDTRAPDQTNAGYGKEAEERSACFSARSSKAEC